MTLTQINDMIAFYLAAEKDVLEGKQVTHGGRTLTLENLAEIRHGRQEWERKRQQLTRRGRGPATTVLV